MTAAVALAASTLGLGCGEASLDGAAGELPADSAAIDEDSGGASLEADAQEVAEPAGDDTHEEPAPEDIAEPFVEPDIGDEPEPTVDAIVAEDVAPDVLPEADTTEPTAGEFGAPCTNNDDCFSGFCVWSHLGQVCSTPCESECPDGWGCSAVGTGGDPTFVCIPQHATLCLPCSASSDCLAVGSGLGARCVSFGDEGSFCGGACDESLCPVGWTCEAVVDVEGEETQQCVPQAGGCDCSPLGEQLGASTACAVSNEAGTCAGARGCGPQGLEACSAQVPAPEACNEGLDDDCDGEADGPDSLGCVLYFHDGDADGFGVTDTQACLCAPEGTLTTTEGGDCNDASDEIGPDTIEQCNGLDDDCDGTVDEAFPDSDGDGAADCVDADDDDDGDPDSLDCAPTDPDVHHAAVELCDGLDQDCDGVADDGFVDTDGDGEADCLDPDDDGDGVHDDADCAPLDPTVSPGAIEVCDQHDQDCDGLIDEDFPDQDGDGTADCADPDIDDDFISNPKDNCPSVANPEQEDQDGDGVGDACDEDIDGDGADNEADCEPTDPAIHPAATELCDGDDETCDGLVDEGFSDLDQDGLADCVDADDDQDGTGDTEDNCPVTFNPGQSDLDSDSIGDACEDDLDGDGDPDATDCAPTDPAIHHGQAEACNSTDDNCNQLVDEGHPDIDGDGLADCVDPDDDNDLVLDEDDTCPHIPDPAQADSDGDGLGDLCDGDDDNDGVPDGSDCSPLNPAASPDHPELCGGGDEDCDGLVDPPDTEGCSLYYRDFDGDGFGNPSKPPLCLCAPDPTSDYTAELAEDCDDLDAAISPAATELCDGVDNNCEGGVDEAFAGLGDACDGADADLCDNGVLACHPSGLTIVCSGEAPTGDPELCNNEDDDCDGTVDEGYDVGAPCGTGVCGDAARTCSGDGLTTLCPTMPGGPEDASGPELCDGLDNDCDGLVDEPDALDATTWWLDYDGDGFGGALLSQVACEAPPQHVEEGGDCNDLDEAVNPDATEVCDDQDNDCDQQVDEDDAADALTWYEDVDGDGAGDPDSIFIACELSEGYVLDAGDCAPGDPSIHHGALELTNGVDDDCDGLVDESSWGTGDDGPLVVEDTFDLSSDTTPGREHADGIVHRLLGLGGNTLNTIGPAVGLAPGDEILLLNLQGSKQAHTSVGAYELRRVTSVSGASVDVDENVETLFGQATNIDLGTQVVVAIRVPNYSEVTVLPGGTLRAGGWSGSGGGVVALRAAGALEVQAGGRVDVHALGYAGGSTGLCYNCDAYQGEGRGGLGGGGTYGGPYNHSTPFWQENLGGGGACVTGGGGEHAGGATPGDSWDGGNANAPQPGLPFGSASLLTLHLGGGGGGVWQGNPGLPGPGGAGGGILYLAAPSITVAGSLQGPPALDARGETTPHWAIGTWTYGAGGGAGGTIWLVADALELGPASVGAAGGAGETGHIRHGGHGGDGRIRLDFTSLNGLEAGSDQALLQAGAACDPDPGFMGAP